MSEGESRIHSFPLRYFRLSGAPNYSADVMAMSTVVSTLILSRSRHRWLQSRIDFLSYLPWSSYYFTQTLLFISLYLRVLDYQRFESDGSS